MRYLKYNNKTIFLLEIVAHNLSCWPIRVIIVTHIIDCFGKSFGYLRYAFMHTFKHVVKAVFGGDLCLLNTTIDVA